MFGFLSLPFSPLFNTYHCFEFFEESLQVCTSSLEGDNILRTAFHDYLFTDLFFHFFCSAVFGLQTKYQNLVLLCTQKTNHCFFSRVSNFDVLFLFPPIRFPFFVILIGLIMRYNGGWSSSLPREFALFRLFFLVLRTDYFEKAV
ncbi:hypothetical protein BJ742DRAFT_793241 [Cladochytrium replicatum]|nr:hypothetical protein BJ742DRAFT_793241 [Cladochytrium replicatum]